MASRLAPPRDDREQMAHHRHVRGLPTGTVTLLFTDVEGSTRLLQELGADRYGAALQQHRDALREAFRSRGGVEVDTQGDAFFYAFPTAAAALDAARAGRDALDGGPIRVRMGLHSGEPSLTEDGYVGEDVHRAARIAACGHGGQILVSAAAAALLPGDELRDLGDHRLKDLSAPERIFQLGDGDFPPLKSLYRTNLPVTATPFLGRRLELAAVVDLVGRDGVRLVTLTGPGGTGKTRLALQAVGALADDYPDGVWWVPLAALRDPELVLSTAARALGAEGPLAEHVGSRRMLILFDNFEHLPDAATGVAELLSRCPALDVLVTSRERLHLEAEHEYPVAPFRREEAVAFFEARADAVAPGFEANGEIPEICRRLDDLPLALELAAARVKVLSAAEILQRLDDSLPLLTGGARDLPERQRTLRATIEWSYALLGEAEQRVLRRFAVFSGGAALGAAEAVTDTDLDTLQSLVDKSLVRFTAGRYWMLETIRAFAFEQLEASDEADEIRRRHALHFVELAESAHVALDPGGEQRLHLVRPDLDNLRAAIDWATAVNPELGLRLVTALEMLWVVTDPEEGMRRLETLLEFASDAPLELRGAALLAFGSCANPAGFDEPAERAYEAGLAAFRELGDEVNVAQLLFRLGNSAFYRGDLERAAELAAESLALNRRVGNLASQAQSVSLVGEVAYAQGDRGRGIEMIAEGARLADEADFAWWRSRMLRKLADCLLEEGRPEEAEPAAREALELLVESGDAHAIVFTLARLARAAAETGREEKAGELWGAIEAEETRRALGGWAKERDRLGAPVLAHAGEAFERGRERGRTLELEQAVEIALRRKD
jgi:predicted ATPase/class 3 adenylate cyclase